MGWLFGKKKVVPQVPLPPGKSMDSRALQFPAPETKPAAIKAAVGMPMQAPPQMMPSRPAPRAPPLSPMMGPLFIKVEAYQRILGEVNELKSHVNKLGEHSKKLEQTEYNEEENFESLQKSVRALHDRLLQVDASLFKPQR